MRANPVDLIGGFYKDDSLPWSCQDTVNWLPTRAEVPDTRTPWKLETCPGLRESLWLGDGSSPIRGMHDLEGQLYFVSGQTLYRKRVGGGVDALGLIPGVSRVQMTHNQFKTGYQLLVENGQGGGGYVWDTSANTFTKITDEGYPGSISSDYMDSYILGVEPQGRYWFHSNLANATDYNSLDRQEAESSPDKIVALAVSLPDVVVFGQRTTEFFLNTGQTTGTFQNRRQSITRGCASRHSVQKLDNTLFWLGDDGIVYRLNGYSARRISTQPLEKAIASYNWSEAISYVWEDRGYKVYYLTFPDGLTFGYDVVSGLWTRRQSFGLDRWRLSHLVKCDGKWYGGDFQTGRLWTIDWDYYLEGQSPMIRRHVTGVLHDNQSQLIVPNVELIFGTGTLPTVPQAPLGPVPQYPGAPVISGSPQAGKTEVPYSYTFTISGGSGNRVRLSSGSLPIGLSISEAGVISGTPTQVGTSQFSLEVKDIFGRKDTWSGTLTVTLSPAFPVVTGWQGFYSSSFATSAPIPLPSVSSGDRLVLLVCFKNNAGAVSNIVAPAGWTAFTSQDYATTGSGFPFLQVRGYYRNCDGSEPSNVTFSANNSGGWGSTCYRIDSGSFNLAEAPVAAHATGNVDTINAPALANPWGVNALHISACTVNYTQVGEKLYPLPSNQHTMPKDAIGGNISAVWACTTEVAGGASATAWAPVPTQGAVRRSIATTILVRKL